MTPTEIYEKIAQIALNAKGPMTFRQLNEKLEDCFAPLRSARNDRQPNGRATASRVKGAYNYYIGKGGRDREVAERISRTFTDDNGNYAFQ